MRALIGALALAALVVAALMLLNQRTAPPGRTLESMFEDEQLLVDQPATRAGNATVAATLATLKSLGVDRIRVLVQWDQVAPAATAAHAPAGFDAADPAAYGSGWSVYDRIDVFAAAVGIKLDFDVTGPAPTWAVAAQPAATNAAARADAHVYGPSAAAFAQFVRAAGRRYSGHDAPSGGSRVLPRVSFWSVWNEPNQPGWLSPQQSPRSGQDIAPARYRALVDAFWDGMLASGHTPARDTLLFGELAPNGCVPGVHCVFARLGRGYAATPPLTFLTDLYCVGPGSGGSGSGGGGGSSGGAGAGGGGDSSGGAGAGGGGGSSGGAGAGGGAGSSGGGALVPLRGARARAVGCPAAGDRARFVAAHPLLFAATGFAEHPYSFSLAPNATYRLAADRSFVPLSELGRLETTLDDAIGAYGRSRRLALYLTEYGYVTNPPNPHYTVTPAQQALYLDEATYLAVGDPRVRALSQFELEDSNPATVCGCRPSDPRYWNSFETGLEFLGGAHKPAYAAYRLPIFLPGLEAPTRPAAPNTPVAVWGMLRPAPNGTTQHARIEWRPSPAAAYRTIATPTTRDPSGLFSVDVVLPASGQLRLAWTPPQGPPIDSRTVAVTVR